MKKKSNKSIPEKEMSFLDHLKELRGIMIVSVLSVLAASIVSYLFYDQIVTVLYTPFENMNHSDSGDLLFINTIFEGFAIRIKTSFLFGLVLSMPIHIFNIIKFIIPGMTSKEKKIITSVLIVSFFLSVISIYYAYFKLIPVSIRFLSGKGFVPQNVGILLNFGKNIFYIFQFLLVTLILFQIPIILEVLLALGIVSRKTLWKSSRYIIIGAFILSALLTPPDFVSQVGLALPLIILFFLALLVAKIFRFGDV